jgi:hypothetical protein
MVAARVAHEKGLAAGSWLGTTAGAKFEGWDLGSFHFCCAPFLLKL